MNVPNYQTLMPPILHVLAGAGGDVVLEDLADEVAARIELDDGRRNELLPSGRETVFDCRLRWALSYLTAQKSITISSTGVVSLRETAGTVAPDDGGGDRPSPKTARPDVTAEEPEAVVQECFFTYYERLKKILIQRIHVQPPAFFEDLIIDLLLAMGYGRCRPDLARNLGRSGDGGVDGVVPQDSLGLDVIYVQAKRYRPGIVVGTAAIRDFAGALDAHKADKGVFVTTAHFPSGAARFVNASRHRIILIDGATLTSLLIRHSVAVRPHLTYEFKHLDEDYFSAKREPAVALLA